MYKRTIWKELKMIDCEIINKEYDSLLIKHSELKRPRWFNKSIKGNYYSRYTGKAKDSYAEGYIIKMSKEVENE